MNATEDAIYGVRHLGREAMNTYMANLPVLMGVATAIFAIPAIVNHLALPPLLVFPIAYPVQSAAMTVYVGMISMYLYAARRGESWSLASLVAEIRPRLTVLGLVGVVIGVATVAGILCLILPALVVLTMWFLVPPFVAIDGLGVAASLRASWRLVRLKVGAVFFISLATSVFTYAIWLLVVPAAAGNGQLARMVGSEVSYLISAPIAAVVISGVYWRLEQIAMETGEVFDGARF
jgi:hypothetical protein